MASISPLKVLLFAENQHMAAIVRAIFHAFGFDNFDHVECLADAIEKLNSLEIDLLIVDHSPPSPDVPRLSKMIRSGSEIRNPYIPILMITGNTSLSAIANARDAGVTEIVSKPLSPKSLFDRVVSIINRPRQFVRAGEFSGPDRRRRQLQNYSGPKRRADELDTTSID